MNKKAIKICLIATAVLLVAAVLLISGLLPVKGKTVTEKIYGTDRITGAIEFEGYNTPVKFELYPDVAPKTVKNFVSLAESGFYDGLSVHRIVSEKIVQMGANEEAEIDAVKGEFSANGVTNKISHTRGILSMARAQDYDSATSQFFIVTGNTCTSLDGSYAAFGKVVDGMETVDKISALPCTDETPNDPPIIKSITIDE